MRVAVVAEVVTALSPLPKYFSTRDLTNVFNSFLNDKAGGWNFVSPERIQNCAINRFCFNWVYRSRRRNVGFRDGKVVKSDRHHALLSNCRQTTNDRYQQCADDKEWNQNGLILAAALQSVQCLIVTMERPAPIRSAWATL